MICLRYIHLSTVPVVGQARLEEQLAAVQRQLSDARAAQGGPRQVGGGEEIEAEPTLEGDLSGASLEALEGGPAADGSESSGPGPAYISTKANAAREGFAADSWETQVGL